MVRRKSATLRAVRVPNLNSLSDYQENLGTEYLANILAVLAPWGSKHPEMREINLFAARDGVPPRTYANASAGHDNFAWNDQGNRPEFEEFPLGFE